MAFNGPIAQLPIGKDGLTGSKNIAQILPSELLIANNITYEGMAIGKEGGAAKYNDTALTGTPSVLAGHDWIHDGSTQRMVVFTSDGDLLKDTGGGDFTVTLASGLTTDAANPPQFVEGGKEAAANDRKLFFFSSQNAVQVLAADGATTSAITSPPADWSGTNQPLFGLIHEGALWAGGNPNDPHRLYMSLTTDHEDFLDTPFSLSIFPGEGEALVGAVSFKKVIVAFKKPRGIYIVDTTDPSSANWKIFRLTSAGGAAGTGSIAIIDNDVAYLRPDGQIGLLSATSEFGDFANASLSQRHQFDDFAREDLNLAQIGRFVMAYYEAKRELHIGACGTGATTNNLRLVVDFNEPGNPRFRTSDRDTPVSLWLKQDSEGVERLTMGDDSGFVWDLDQETRSVDGSGYTAEFRSSNTDLSFLDPKFATIRKMGRFLEIVTQPKGNWDLNVGIYWDDVLHETITFNMGTSGAALGSFVLGTDQLSGDTLLNRKRRITGSGRRFSIDATQGGAGQDFQVSAFYLHFQPSNERLD